MGEVLILGETGRYEVVFVERKVLGSFTEHYHAELFKSAFKEALNAEEPSGETSHRPVFTPRRVIDRVVEQSRWDAPDHPPAPVMADATGASSEAFAEAALKAAGVAAPDPDAPTPPKASEVMEAKLKLAEPRLLAGEKMTNVADDLEIGLGKLRAWWTSRKKELPDATVAPVPATRAKTAVAPGATGPAEIARTDPPRLSDEKELELLEIVGGPDHEKRLDAFAWNNGLTAVECRRIAQRLLRAGEG